MLEHIRTQTAQQRAINNRKEILEKKNLFKNPLFKNVRNIPQAKLTTKPTFRPAFKRQTVKRSNQQSKGIERAGQTHSSYR